MHRCAALLLILGLATNAMPARASGNAVFSAGIAGGDGFAQFPLWQALLQKVHNDGDDRKIPMAAPRRAARLRQDGDDALPRDCDTACARRHWVAFLQSIRREPKLKQIEATNRWVNQWPYVEDWMNWGEADYWETPPELMLHGGDCEDFAIAKYLSLIRLGFAPSDLRIVVVEDRNLKASHAVVAARLDGRTWLLDIAVPQVIPAEIAPQYRPVYAFNGQGWWLYPPVREAASH